MAGHEHQAMQTTHHQPTARNVHRTDAARLLPTSPPPATAPQRAAAAPQLSVGWAVNDDEVREAQALRWRVFAV